MSCQVHPLRFKRALDVVVSGGLLALLWWLILLLWAVATLETRENGFFLQERVGRHGRPFRLVKIRTMRSGGSTSPVTIKDDPRVTLTGRLMRQAKLDELPQLINVLRGDMSLVGPRPDVAGFADRLEGEDRIILCVRPGITGPATIAFRHEEDLLEGVEDPERFNEEVLWPKKVELNRRYVEEMSLRRDLQYLLETLRGLSARG